MRGNAASREAKHDAGRQAAAGDQRERAGRHAAAATGRLDEEARRDGGEAGATRPCGLWRSPGARQEISKDRISSKTTRGILRTRQTGVSSHQCHTTGATCLQIKNVVKGIFRNNYVSMGKTCTTARRSAARSLSRPHRARNARSRHASLKHAAHASSAPERVDCDARYLVDDGMKMSERG